jgi:hypothetical protein
MLAGALRPEPPSPSYQRMSACKPETRRAWNGQPTYVEALQVVCLRHLAGFLPLDIRHATLLALDRCLDGREGGNKELEVIERLDPARLDPSLGENSVQVSGIAESGHPPRREALGGLDQPLEDVDSATEVGSNLYGEPSGQLRYVNGQPTYLATLALVAATAELADAEVALALADATIHDGLDEVIKRTLGKRLTLGSHGDKTGGAPEPHQRRLALEVRRHTVHPVGDGLLRQDLHVDEQHGRHDDGDDGGDDGGDDVVEWAADIGVDVEKGW